jgi:hypothetical protein
LPGWNRYAAVFAVALAAACTAPDVVGETQPSPSEPHGALACDTETRSAIDETIGAQLAAFADADFAAALGFASERFRAGNSPAQFEAVITNGFPALIGAADHTIEVCVARGDNAQVLVTIESAGGQTDDLVYDMTREPAGWRIDVAGYAASEEAVPV